MTIKLFGWDGQQNSFEIGDLSTIDHADMWVYDGREYLTVTYKDGRVITYSDDTVHGHCDGGYPVYISVAGFSLFADEVWMNDKSAYDRMLKSRPE